MRVLFRVREIRNRDCENHGFAIRRNVQVGNVFDAIKIFDCEGAFLSVNGSERNKQEYRKQKDATHHSLVSLDISFEYLAAVYIFFPANTGRDQESVAITRKNADQN
jgi:hypothetical protein